ncbi:uncharacterized protein J8A68_004184 [[Candida] subhashii]|uniref:Dynactin subunit 5 n=1 Tax=[Candida] subhashii TaxID=561895 RepID=A0A8J5QT87_9ASCO|nr:uncharacterized protein J8A68_004184 [[Candida] subhashii]KAG7662290.1 hypothetical protein J8A68_004184 [[Candida] subhashii]
MSDWLETATGNRISRAARLLGTDKISIGGNCSINENVLISGDVTLNEPKQQYAIQFGKYCYLGSNCQIIPPILKKAADSDSETLHGPQSIGAYVIIGQNSIIKSSNIGNRVLIEENSILEDLSIVYECCVIREGTIIPPKMVIPPYSEVSGIPGKDFQIRSLHNSYKKSIEIEAKQLQILG